MEDKDKEIEIINNKSNILQNDYKILTHLTYKSLIIKHFKVAIPLIIFYFSISTYDSISVAILGKNYSGYLDVIGIAQTYLDITLYSFVRSFPIGFETLGSILITEIENYT